MNSKEKLEKEKEDVKKYAMTVGDLKAILKDVSDDVVVGRVGHFGELHYAWKTEAGLKKAYITSGRWGDDVREDVEIFEISSPDIGDEPD